MTLTPEQREEIARAIAPSSWAVMDGYLKDMLRKYKGENCGYDPENFKHKESLTLVATAIEPIINRLIEDARDKALERAAVVAEGEVVPIYDDTPNEIDATSNSVVRGISTAIRALKTKD